MKTSILSLILIICASVGFTQSLWINDPQTWRGGPGTIEETKITYEPQGLFMKVDWEITFSARGINDFSESDTVEVVYNFNLPEGTVVIDSWLWFNDSIIEAMIIDRWTASMVYENIVNRRRDPSILTKNWGTSYELRIFPMAAKESRKVKISFLAPTSWTENLVNSHFLSGNLMVSKYAIESIDVFANVSSEWGTPAIVGTDNLLLEPESGEETTHHVSLDFKSLKRDQKFSVNSPMKDGYYLNYFENGDEKFYELALYPAEGMDIRKPQKVLFLVDFQKENSELNQAELLARLKSKLVEMMNEKDSFNILFYDFELQQASEDWIEGDSASIVQAIDNMGEEPFVSYSNLPTLLASGVEIAQNEVDSKIVLLANSDKLDDIESANQLIEDLLELMNPVQPIYIGDFQTKNYYNNWIQNVNYRGNEYFYRNLAKQTGGDYIHSFDGNTFPDCLQNIYQLATNEAGIIDIHTTLDNGFCYGRYILSQQNSNILNSIYLETGKYSGDFPFQVEVSGVYDNEIFTKNLSITKEEAMESDTLIATYWYGNEIMEMENSSNYYSIINDIIDKSMDKRILSNYTAFLCLEPGMLGELEEVNDPNRIKGPEWDDGIAISTEDIETPKPAVNVYPNPFTDRINIEVVLPEEINMENCQLEIYDLFGKRIKIFNIEEFNGDSEIRLIWDATDASGITVPKGTYIFICTTPEGKISKKLILL